MAQPINQALGFDPQTAVNQRTQQFAPPKPTPQLPYPQWKEGQPGWLRAMSEQGKIQKQK
ncbi:MAG: hypothetical protein ABUS47_16470 [Steroidobacter sp.]